MHVRTILLATAIVAATAINWTAKGSAANIQPGAVAFDAAFWQLWSDGQAELAAYDLTYPRYGETRRGTAVTIFVKEDFANSVRVKTNPGRPAADTFPVMKLNLVQDFPTGVYDYNMMASTFVALAPVNGRPAGTPTKVSFSSQEWCGHVYSQLLFDKTDIRQMLHSYFDGEADRTGTLDYPPAGVAEDALLFWARGMAEPALRPGESTERPLLASLEQSRLLHRPLAWQSATFARAAERETVTVPAGTFDTEVFTVETRDPPRRITISVEHAAPHRVVRWTSSQGHRAELLGSKRLKYWQMNGGGFEATVREFGLMPRPARTP